MNPVRRKFFFGTISFILFILHAVVGSLIYQAIENRFPIIERRNTTVKCLRGRELKSVIFYVNGISLTLGYKQVYPCTTLGRAFSVLHCFMGLPITIAIIGRIGELCEFVLRKIWKGIVRVSVFFHWKYKDFNFNRDYPVPFTFGLIMTIAVMSVVFYASYEMENSYREISFLDSAYITLRTITKIGIGKYAPSEYYYIILGISFSGLIVFSTAFRVFKSNVAEWIRLVDEKIKKEKIIDFNFSEDSELEAKALHRLQKVLHSTVGPILSRLLLSTESKEKLKEVLLAHYRKRNVSAQAVVSTKTHLSQHSPSLKDGHSQVYIEVSDKETEISLKCSNAETQTTISESTMQLVQTDISFMIDRHRYKITRIPKNFLRVAPS